jgi:DNA-binding winged helix-turn-helix (wHTH) protein/tetratricopeptide (TPR) repeat protein
MNPAGPAETTVYRFAGCELDVARRELRRDGATVDIQPRVFELLVYLIRHRDRAVGKDEIQDAVWTGMVVTEASLTRAVMKARRAVGDDSASQAFIRTVHGHGYRFVAPLAPAPEPAPPAGAVPGLDAAAAQAGQIDLPGAKPPPAAEVRAGGQVRQRIIAALVAVAAVAGAWLLLWPPFPAQEAGRVAVLPVKNATGDPSFDWARLGLMSLGSRLIETEGELAVVPDSQLLLAVEASGETADPLDGPGADLRSRLQRGLGATHIVASQLASDGGLLRLTYAVYAVDGVTRRGTMVGHDATELTRGMARAVVAAVSGRKRLRGDQAVVSSDPFVNEAFARGMALSLEGRCGEARPLFQVAIDHTPEEFLPRYEYAVCARILGEQDVAAEILERLVAERRAAGADRALAMALNALGVVYNRTGRLDEAEAAEIEALEVARQAGDAELAGGVLTNLSIVAEDRGELAQAAELLDRAILAYRESGRDVPPGQVYSALANLAIDQGQLDTADAHLERALAAFRLVGDRRRTAMMVNNLGLVRRQQGRLDEAEALHLESYSMREELGDVMGMGRVRNMLATLYLARGQYEEAKDSAQEAVDIARQTRDRLFEGTGLSHRGSAELELGEIDAAEGSFHESREVFVAIQDHMRVLMTDLRIASVGLARGDAEQVERTAAEVLQAARVAQLNMPEIEALELLADASRARGETAAAEARYREALAAVRNLSWERKESELALKLAGLYLDREALTEAEPLVGIVSRQPAELPGLRLQARFALAKGDPAAAARIMQQAQVLGDRRWSAEDEAVATASAVKADVGPR